MRWTWRGRGLAWLGIVLMALTAVTQQPPPADQNSGTDTSPSETEIPSAEPGQAGVIAELLERIRQLELRDAQRELQNGGNQQGQVEKLLDRIKELEEKVRALEAGRAQPDALTGPDGAPSLSDLDRRLREAEAAAELRARESPRLSIGSAGFVMSSADTNFVLKLKGLIQTDTRVLLSDSPYLVGNDSFILRRARPILEGTVFRDFDFQLVPDFAGVSAQIFDAWVNYRYQPELQLRVGKFKGPVGLEHLQSDALLPFNERSLASVLVPIRNLGFQLWGDFGNGDWSYAAGVFNGTGDARNPNSFDFDDEPEFSGRLFVHPFRRLPIGMLHGFGIGFAGSYSQVGSSVLGLPGTTGGVLPGYITSVAQQFFAYNPAVGAVVADGRHWRVTPHGYYFYGPFGLLGEFIISNQRVLNLSTTQRADLQHQGWQVNAQWVLTGEKATFAGVNPRRPFNPLAGSWGALQVAARIARLDIDDDAFPAFSNPATSARSATSWSVGLNWWLNRNLRVLTSFSHTSFDGGGQVDPAIPSTLLPPATVTHQDENAFLSRVQLAF